MLRKTVHTVSDIFVNLNWQRLIFRRNSLHPSMAMRGKKYSLDDAMEILSSTDSMLVNEFASSFLYSRGRRPVDPKIQHKILKKISQHPKVSDNKKIFSIIASAHKAIEAQSVELMLKARDELKDLKDSISNMAFSDSIRDDRIHATSSMLLVEASLNFFLEDRKNFHATLSCSFEEFENLDVKYLRSGFFNSCENFAQLLGLCYLASVSLKLDPSIVCKAILNDFKAGLLMLDSSEELSKNLMDLEIKDHASCSSFVKSTRIYYLASKIESDVDGEDMQVFRLELLLSCLRHSVILSAADRERKLSILF
ncbi:hypothetical protein [Roseinatronobacter sp. S2]|uniref:hypothetical protein n=1 Tax=Roseinatronobacter sp. S2 TaxID=3035471 RepID=UPI002410377B|nr:hypothetical protein [Roseinatronobacter sp. S2]WFE74184.1 hypothetical protein P8S53_13475 [Roseinatronobacter sp. S2]